MSKYLCLLFVIKNRKGYHIQKIHEFTQINVKYLEESEGSVRIISKPIIRHIP
jgi:hypothetical protein